MKAFTKEISCKMASAEYTVPVNLEQRKVSSQCPSSNDSSLKPSTLVAQKIRGLDDKRKTKA